MSPECHTHSCPKTLPMMKVATKSTWKHEVFFCPVCGSEQTKLTLRGAASEAAPTVAAAGSIIMAACAIVSVLHGDHPEIDPPDFSD